MIYVAIKWRGDDARRAIAIQWTDNGAVVYTHNDHGGIIGVWPYHNIELADWTDLHAALVSEFHRSTGHVINAAPDGDAAVRTGGPPMDGAPWQCTNCQQVNAYWATTCGRCEWPRDGVAGAEMPDPEIEVLDAPDSPAPKRPGRPRKNRDAPSE